MLVTAKQITGWVAQWAVRQSPYAVPENLESVIRQLYAAIAFDTDQFGLLHFEDTRELEAYFIPKLRAIPEYMAWNQSKRASKAPFKFVSRFDAPGHPDDDFIDISALEGNVARSIWREELENA